METTNQPVYNTTDKFWLAEGAELFVYSQDKAKTQVHASEALLADNKEQRFYSS